MNKRTKRSFIYTKPAVAALLVTALAIGFPQTSQAIPSNGTRFPPAREVEFGYEYNAMFKRTLNNSHGEVRNQDQFYTVSFGAFDWLALDGKIGMGDVGLKNSANIPKLDFNAGFAGGYGFRIRAFEHKKLGVRLILGAQHISVHPPERSIDDEKFRSCFDDWQGTGIVAKDFRQFTVYAGMKVSDGQLVYTINKDNQKRLYSENHVGMVTGLEVYLFDNKLRIGAEGRFFDETAFSTTASYLFW
ncbi:MAG: hypothetical protein PHI58_00575 [Candidatus Omnitrophica bacterium]|nr:hypothetical protein [Candidatus Omnitrophota bacterium]